MLSACNEYVVYTNINLDGMSISLLNDQVRPLLVISGVTLTIIYEFLITMNQGVLEPTE